MKSLGWRKGILFIALAGSFPASVCAQCGELSFIEAINQALDANQALVAARQTLDAQQKDVAIARSRMLPAISVTTLGQISEGPTFSSTVGIIPEQTIQSVAGVGWTLYDQTDIDSLGAQKHLYRSQQEGYEGNRVGTIASAGQSYLSVLLQRALLFVQNANLGLTEQSLEITAAQEGVGDVPYREVLRWQAQRYSDQQKVATQEGGVLVSRFQLNQIRNRPAEETCLLQELTVAEDGFIFSSDVVAEAISDERKATLARDYLVGLGVERSPSLRVLDAQIRAQLRQTKSTRRWLIPDLSAGAGAAAFLLTAGEGSDQQPAGNIFWRVGLQLDWNVLSGGAYIAGMNQAHLELASLEWQRDNAATSLEENIRGTAAVAMASFYVIGLSSLYVAAAQQNYDLVNDAYLEGEATFLELIDSQQQLLAANVAARQALYQFLSDLLTLEQSMAYYPFFEEDADARVRELEAKLEGR